MPFQAGGGPFIPSGRTSQYASTKNQQQQDLQGKLPPLSNNETPSQAAQNLQHLPEMNKGAFALPAVKAEMGAINVAGKVSAQAQNAAGACAGEMGREAKRATMAASNNDASKPASMNNNFCASSNNSCNVKQEVFDNLNLAEFDQEFLGELLDGIDW